MQAKKIWVFLLFLIAVSCSDEDNTPAPIDVDTKVIGDFTYSLLQGNDQTGIYGQLLPNEIELRISDRTGKPIEGNLQYEISDASGSLGYQYLDGTISLYWWLGCNEGFQTLKITDNICGLAKDGCIDVEIFEIQAIASDTVKGWFASCEGFGYGEDLRIFADDEWVSIITSQHVYTTSDPITGSWLEITPSYDLRYTSIKTSASGAIYYCHRNNCYVSEDVGKNWSRVSIPANYYSSNSEFYILESGKYIFALEYDVYESIDKGQSWDVILDLFDPSTEPAGYVRSVVGNSDKTYVIADNGVILETKDTTLPIIHKFDFNSWPGEGDLTDYFAIIEGDKILLSYKGREIYEINLTSNTASKVLDLSIGAQMIRSAGNIYLVDNSNTYHHYQNGSFVSKSFESPPNLPFINERIESLTFFKGAPAFVDTGGTFFYYIN